MWPGQFRAPRHIIRLMVEMTAPGPKDVICDPACGTAGFLVAAGEYIREHHPTALHDPKQKRHFHQGMFHGFDFDNTMLRIGSMNMLLHGVENPAIRYRDSPAQDHAGEEERYSLVLANPPFAGALNYWELVPAWAGAEGVSMGPPSGAWWTKWKGGGEGTGGGPRLLVMAVIPHRAAQNHCLSQRHSNTTLPQCQMRFGPLSVICGKGSA